VNSRTESFVLLLFGGALVRLATSDALLRYVRPVARPFVLAAGLAILALAAWSITAALRRPHDVRTGDRTDAHGHRAASRAGWLILAPVVTILVVAPPALGSYSAGRTPVMIAKPADIDFPPLPGGNPARVSMIDFATRALWDDGRTLDGRTVSLTGFVLDASAGGFTFARLVITCCAADAQPVEIGVLSGTPAPRRDQWVTVTGGYAGVNPSDSTLPMVRATSVIPVGQPSNPYDD
jgi:uncharacterized repeat protein (TIGR03943 family)